MGIKLRFADENEFWRQVVVAAVRGAMSVHTHRSEKHERMSADAIAIADVVTAAWIERKTLR